MASHIMQHFTTDHLPKDLQLVSEPICGVARALDGFLPDCAEKSTGLRKLLEAKDSFVRAAIEARTQENS